jgi:hypothetical protein
MTPEELRLECLKLVLQSVNASGLPQVETRQLLSRARAYADFVMGQNGGGGVDSANGGAVTLEEGLLRRHPVPISELDTSIDAAELRGAR